MIIENSPSILKYDAFVAGLERAASGVLHILIRSPLGSAICTGWLITDSLVVAPQHAVEGGTEFVCRSHLLPGETLAAELVATAPSDAGIAAGSVPALLRLPVTWPERAMRLAVDNPQPGDLALLLQHQQGLPDLHLSLGTVVEIRNAVLRYNANTDVGAGGAPVLNQEGALVAMHVAGEQGRNLNEGIALVGILAALRTMPAWSEVAHYHGLAELQRATAIHKSSQSRASLSIGPVSDADLLWAAVRWHFDPQTAFGPDRERLHKLVISPGAARWTLRPRERLRLLEMVTPGAGALDQLRQARGAEPLEGPGQAAIDRILQGPPYDLDTVAEAALPYWLQAVRWFARVLPALPAPAAVNRELERRRVRSRLQAMAGPDFRGRDSEMQTLAAWYANPQAGPALVTGIGGIGKSALVAHFVLSLPPQTLILWLDFDRADIAPDDAVSVLRLLSAQAVVQMDGFQSQAVDGVAWQVVAQAMGNAFAAHVADHESGALLVLDGFEVAQHVQQYQEIWALLEVILNQMPSLHVVVSGRAPVDDLALHGRAAEPVVLTGLEPSTAAAWLREQGIDNQAAIDAIVNISNGVPLVLRLAVQWLQAGGDIAELDAELPRAVIEGFLYRRILDRVIDLELKPVARHVLVLRRLTAEMLPHIVGDSMPPGLDAEEVFARLAQELALVQGDDAPAAAGVVLSAGDGVLSLRPEVRAATLKLLETEDPAHVRMVDERAAAWYAGQDLDQAVNAAELIYHRLRLDDIAGADAVWRDELAPLLRFAEQDLPEDATEARAWLRQQTGAVPHTLPTLNAWENDALARIRAALARGLVRAMPEILRERSERSAASPLLVYDAWLLRDRGEPTAARTLLADPATTAEGPVARDRAVVAALLATEAGEPDEADRLLAPWQELHHWTDSTDGDLASLAVRAARVHLAVDLETEVDLATLLDPASNQLVDAAALQYPLMTVLPPADAVLPPLAAHIAGPAQYTKEIVQTWTTGLEVPTHEANLATFAESVDLARKEGLSRVTPFYLPVVEPNAPDTFDETEWAETKDQLLAQLDQRSSAVQEDRERIIAGLHQARALEFLGWRRWRIAVDSPFLAQTCAQVLQPGGPTSLSLSLLGTLALFHSHSHALDLVYQERSFAQILDKATENQLRGGLLALTPPRLLLAQRVLEHLVRADTVWIGKADQAWLESVQSLAPSAKRNLDPIRIPVERLRELENQKVRALALHLFCPEPLLALARWRIGVPDPFVEKAY